MHLYRWFTPKEVHLMKSGTLAKPCRYMMIEARPMCGLCPSRAMAQSGHLHAPAAPQKLTVAQQIQAQTVVDAVRSATNRFQDVGVATAEGYALQFGCVSGSDLGAMGLHYVNGSLLDDAIDV